MDQAIVNPIRGKGEKELPENGILLINPSDALPLINQAAKSAGQRRAIYNSNLLVIPATVGGRDIFISGPAVGAPMAVLSLDKLIALGAKRVIVYGWAGSINQKLSCGNLLLPTQWQSSEGTSCHYPLPGLAAKSSDELRGRLEILFKAPGSPKVKQGPIWTTDAPYRETGELVKMQASKGAMAVEMEFAALATVALFRKIELAGALLISDALLERPYISKVSSKEFQKQSRKIARTIIKALSEGKI